MKNLNEMAICELLELWETLGFEFEINDGKIVNE